MINEIVKSSTKTGKIEHVSIQGHNYYAVARFDGEDLPDMIGNTVPCNRYLAGVLPWTPEKTVTMAEVLIPLNMSSTTQITDPKLMIGSKCLIHLSEEEGMKGYPISITLISTDDSRSISRKSMWGIRNISKDSVIDDVSRIYVKENGLVKEEELIAIEGEVYTPDGHKGFIGVYADVQDPFRTSTKDSSDMVDMSSKIDRRFITGIAGTREVRTKECYIPATVFTGRT